MIYEAYEAQTDLVDLFHPLAAGAGQALRLPWPVLLTDWPTRLLAGALETFANLTVTRMRGLPLASNPFQSAIVSSR
jgi:hypothetical protein